MRYYHYNLMLSDKFDEYREPEDVVKQLCEEVGAEIIQFESCDLTESLVFKVSKRLKKLPPYMTEARRTFRFRNEE